MAEQEEDSGVVAASALVGGVATLIQELVVAGAVDPARLRSRLRTFVQQDAIQSEPRGDRLLIERVIAALQDAIDIAEQERKDNAT